MMNWKRVDNKNNLLLEILNSLKRAKNDGALVIWDNEFEDWYDQLCNPWDLKLRDIIKDW